MLGLRQQVGGGELGGRAAVGHDDHLGGPGERVDADDAGDLTLGGGDVRVPRPHDHVDRADALGAVGEGGDGLGAADPVHLVDADHRGRGEGRIGHPAVGPRRHAQDDLGHPGHPRGDRGHQDGGRVRGAPTGHVEPGAVDRAGDLLELDPGARRRGAGWTWSSS